MQSGYRLDQASETKALKAALWNRKMDNLSYGSDIKLEGPKVPTVVRDQRSPAPVGPITIGVPTQVSQPITTTTATPAIVAQPVVRDQRSPAPVGPNQPVAQPVVRDQRSPAPVGPNQPVAQPVAQTETSPVPSAPRKTTITPSSPLHEQIMKTISPGVSPSAVKRANSPVGTQKTTVGVQPAPPPTIITTGELEMKATKPMTQSPISDASSEYGSVKSVSPTATESTIATASLPIARSRGKDNISEIATSIKPIDKDLTPNLDNPDLQNLARAFLNTVKKGQQTITLYTIEGPKANDKLVLQSKESNKTHFFAKGKGTGERKIDNQSFYNVQGSIEEAAKRLEMGDYWKDVVGKTIFGLGLSETNPNIHWAQRLDKSDKNFVMYPTWVRGNIRLYTTGTRRAAVSHNKASKAFLNMVADIVNRGTFEQADYAALEPSETQAANTVIRVAKPLIPSGVRFSVGNVSDINALRKRYKVLVSELAAGNQGKMIRDEMIGILQSLQRLKAMPKSKVDDLISGLNDL